MTHDAPGERVTSVSAGTLVAQWPEWEKRIKACECKIEFETVYEAKEYSPVFVIINNRATRVSEEFKVTWLTPAAEGQGDELKWSYERLEAEYREVCNNLIDLIAEMGLGDGRGGEKVDKIVCNTYRQQQARNADLQRLCLEAVGALKRVQPIVKDMAIGILVEDVLRKAGKGGEE